ncbi:hypothetical protein EVAR_44474_1 [Eumeta japonica]|uniref:Uncharacterized protein n=1 Tax=Eumeta variegata TaxID=151549 RepID=A0A4C1WMG7_EUMVA|nr:hypothetical protein EVAR_44474_1 [Eumeta japonica]
MGFSPPSRPLSHGENYKKTAVSPVSSGCSSVAIGRLRSSPQDHPFSLVCYCVSVFLRAAFRSVGLRACMSAWGATQWEFLVRVRRTPCVRAHGLSLMDFGPSLPFARAEIQKKNAPRQLNGVNNRLVFDHSLTHAAPRSPSYGVAPTVAYALCHVRAALSFVILPCRDPFVPRPFLLRFRFAYLPHDPACVPCRHRVAA